VFKRLREIASTLFVTPVGLEAAEEECQKLMEHCGFWTPTVSQTEIEIIAYDNAAAYYELGDGKKPGCIFVPAVSPYRVGMAISGGNLIELLLHEYGHAVADVNRGLMRSSKFSDVFGYSHDSEEDQDFDPEIHITEYGSTNASEDFAECFSEFVSRRGRIHKKFPAGIQARLRFIRRLSVAIRANRRKW